MTHHRRVVLVFLLDNNQNVIANITDRLIDGQLDIDADADIGRKVMCTVHDPDYQLGLDHANVNNGALFADRMIAVVYQVLAPDQSYWFGIPIFMGPVSKVNRIGNFLALEGSGKEYFFYSSSWWKRTYQKGWMRHDVIRRLLLDGGERLENYWVPDSPHKVGKDIAISFDQPMWPVIEEQAYAMGRPAFYDARGDCIIRPNSSVSSYTFRKFCSEPEISYNVETTINSVLVIGAVPKGKKAPLTRRFVAPNTHALNPYKIGRIGWDGNVKPRYFSRVINDAGLTSMAQIIAVGNKALTDGLMQGIEASFTAPVIPDLEEMDVYTMIHEGVATTSRFRKCTIPFTGAPIATYGFLRKIAPNKIVIRRRK
jgi:hypothetical protein